MKDSYDVSAVTKESMFNEKTKISRFRRIFPQILASTVKNLLLLDLGLSMSFSTIVIPVLTMVHNSPGDKDFYESIYLSAADASWLGSVSYICQPLGSIISGWMSEPLGRKRSMFIVNVPHLVGWLIMYNASEAWHVFAGVSLFGLGVGLMEAPILTYIGEICEPSVRGILTACSGLASALGTFMILFMGSLMLWRDAALVCCLVPILAMIAICFIPETPLWLLSRNRPDDALKSLQWLRGWVQPIHVRKEFQGLQRYNEHSNSCKNCIKQNQKCHHPPLSTSEKFQELMQSRNLRPFLMVLLIFALSQFTGLQAMKPYQVKILLAYGVNIDANWAATAIGLSGLCGTIVLLCVVRLVGKRKIYLFALSTTFKSCLSLGFYAWQQLPKGWSSFDEHKPVDGTEGNNLPFFIFIALSFCTNLGVLSIPWMLVSEIFPIRTRILASGLAAAFTYVMAFVATKTYYNLELLLSMPGVTLLYGFIGLIGFIVVYFIMPETENRTLEDIELYFSDKNRKLTDRKIPKTSKTFHNDIEMDHSASNIISTVNG